MPLSLKRLLAPAPPTETKRTLARLGLGGILVFAGTSHLTFARKDFRAQVPPWLPLPVDLVVVLSGIVEIALGSALLLLGRQRVPVGWIVATFFVAIFPGNIAQYAEHRDAFGLDTDAKRLARLPGQPLLVWLALWSTGAWRDRRRLTS
ncbi:hypothetical protein NY547_07815 [Cnuibacter physcomitrellae]|uniref:DoxX family protein n=1 Tax=Cnuibacter physcomitrellae TaxID=1619308 RepID=UPI0021758B5D|nr:hypothetical protein [Cnuibacter physcomitrellae]MCS5497139.1 hypothetical protein [Cnuibacter physcomitrellae]